MCDYRIINKGVFLDICITIIADILEDGPNMKVFSSAERRVFYEIQFTNRCSGGANP